MNLRDGNSNPGLTSTPRVPERRRDILARSEEHHTSSNAVHCSYHSRSRVSLTQVHQKCPREEGKTRARESVDFSSAEGFEQLRTGKEGDCPMMAVGVYGKS